MRRGRDDIHEADGNAVVEPEDDPAQIIERMERLVEETSSERGETMPVDEGPDPIATTHRDAALDRIDALSYYCEHIDERRGLERAHEAALERVRESSMKPN